MASIDDCELALQNLISALDGIDHTDQSRKVPDRTVELVLLDYDVAFSAHWRGGELCDLKRAPCPGKPNVRLTMTSDDLIAMIDGELSLPHAWATGRVRLDASVRDILRLRRLL